MQEHMERYGPQTKNAAGARALLSTWGTINTETATGLFFETIHGVHSINGRIIEALQVLGTIHAIDVVKAENSLFFDHLKFVVVKEDAHV